MDSLKKVTSVIMELSSRCNLNCLYCNNNNLNEKTSMPYEKAVEYFYKVPHDVKKYTFHFSGESFLNRDAVRIIKFLADNDRYMSICTNGMVSSKLCIDALSNGLNELIFSIDGFNNHTHESYRVGSSLPLIKKNLETAINNKPPHATVGVLYLVTRNNENEIEDMRKYLTDIGADFFYLKSISLNLGANKALEETRLANAKSILPSNERYSRYSFVDNNITLKCPMDKCHLIYEPVITANGDIAICCVDFEKPVNAGNLGDYQSFADLWRSEKYIQIRRKAQNKELESCKRCNFTTMGVIYEIGEPNGRTGENTVALTKGLA